jgi:hypothetical protein
MKNGQPITLSTSDHSDLLQAVIGDFVANFVPGGELVYVGDAGAESEWGHDDQKTLTALNVSVTHDGKLPDVVIYDREKNWLILVEAVVATSPIDEGRHAELADLFKDSKAGLVYVTAFPDRGEVFQKYLDVMAWETEVWCASDPTHLIHFNGNRFFGPYHTP